MRRLLRLSSGDPLRGREVFRRVCAQCHRLFGEGQDVGPDLTLNGRGSLDQLVSNVFDPSLVIGTAYQARTVLTTDGRILTGLLVEDSPQRVVLKLQGGKLETIPRDEIDQLRTSELSLMPEGLEKQLAPQEIADLFALLLLERPPAPPAAGQP
jgi:putative heme-binding domain-containing protein